MLLVDDRTPVLFQAQPEPATRHHMDLAAAIAAGETEMSSLDVMVQELVDALAALRTVERQLRSNADVVVARRALRDVAAARAGLSGVLSSARSAAIGAATTPHARMGGGAVADAARVVDSLERLVASLTATAQREKARALAALTPRADAVAAPVASVVGRYRDQLAMQFAESEERRMATEAASLRERLAAAEATAAAKAPARASAKAEVDALLAQLDAAEAAAAAQRRVREDQLDELLAGHRAAMAKIDADARSQERYITGERAELDAAIAEEQSRLERLAQRLEQSEYRPHPLYARLRELQELEAAETEQRRLERVAAAHALPPKAALAAADAVAAQLPRQAAHVGRAWALRRTDVPGAPLHVVGTNAADGFAWTIADA